MFIVLLTGLSQILMVVVAIIVFVILAAISCLILYKYLKDNNTFVIKASSDRNKNVLDFTEALGNEQKKAKEDSERFSKLLVLDDDNSLKNVGFLNDKFTLKEFCDEFRNFCATVDKEKPLYYSIEDIRAFVSNLATSKIMILQGMSGTGKTSIALAFQKFIGNVLEPIPIQPMWKERSDVIGYFNEFTKKFNETDLLVELYKSNLNDKIYIIVLDEVNIARIEYYFAEFLSLLEYPNEEQKTLEVTNDVWDKDPLILKDKEHPGRLPIGDNVYFLGTANNDESTFAISDKVYDRAMILNLNQTAEEFTSNKAPKKYQISNTQFTELYKDAISSFSSTEEAKKLDKWIEEINQIIIDSFDIGFGNRMISQMKKYVPVYISCGGSFEEAFDDFISKKILRKLEGKDFLRLKDEVKVFINRINNTFGENSLPKCINYVSKFMIIG